MCVEDSFLQIWSLLQSELLEKLIIITGLNLKLLRGMEVAESYRSSLELIDPKTGRTI